VDWTTTSTDSRLQDKLGIDSTNAADIFHESAGWKTLETGCKYDGGGDRGGLHLFASSHGLCFVAGLTLPCHACRALHHVTQACGASFGPQLDGSLIDLVFNAIKHTNRFVRETGYYVCNEFVKIVQEDVAAELNLVSVPVCRSDWRLTHRDGVLTMTAALGHAVRRLSAAYGSPAGRWPGGQLVPGERGSVGVCYTFASLCVVLGANGVLRGLTCLPAIHVRGYPRGALASAPAQALHQPVQR